MNYRNNFSNGIIYPELFIGVVSYVSANSIRVNLAYAGYPSGSHFMSGRYGRGEVGEFVLIEGQTYILLGRIIEIKLPEDERKSIKSSAINDSQIKDAIAGVQLLGSISMDNFEVKTGISCYPRLGDKVYSAPHSFISKIPLLMDSDYKGIDKDEILLSIGTVDVSQKCEVRIKPEKLFGRHCAILGTTGGGKSWTTARLIEECIKYNSKIILIDPTGEYRSLLGEEIKHCFLGSEQDTPDTEDSEQCSLPPNSFIESDFIALFEPSGRVQGPKLRSAIRSLRLAKLLSKEIAEKLAPDGYILKNKGTKQQILEKEKEYASQLDNPQQEFDVNLLVKQIEQECVLPWNWDREDESSLSYCTSLITRIDAVLNSPAFYCVFKSKDKKSLIDIIDEFLDGHKRLLRICVSDISYEYKAREIIANTIGRVLLNKARNGAFINKPVIVFLDEAHNFIGRSIGTEDNIYNLDAFELIAKEARKYGLTICLATQRPRDITEGVLSQMGTFIVHRLINDRDRQVVEHACSEIDQDAASFIPNLKPGEAAIIGVDFPIPLTIQMLKPSMPPKSNGPDYQNAWRVEQDKEESL